MLHTVLTAWLLSQAIVLSVYANTNQDLKAIDKSIRLRDYTLAVKQLQPLLEQQNAEAQYRIASLYRSGAGVEKNIKSAMQYFEKAAHQNHPEAQYALGSILEKQNKINSAKRWYQLSAKQGEKKALRKLKLLQNSKDQASSYSVNVDSVFNAIKHNDINLIQNMINSGFSFEITDTQGRTPLHVSLLSGHEKMAQKLLKVTHYLDQIDSQGNNALHIAVTNGYLKIVKQLITLKVNLNTADTLGNPPLHIAVKHDNTQMVETLLQQNVDYKIKNNKNQSAVDIALTRNNKKILSLFSDYGIQIRKTKKRFSNVDQKSLQEITKQTGSLYKGWPILSVTSLLGEVAMTRQLIKQGANIQQTDSSGFTALHRAASKGQNGTIKILLENGININAMNNQGKTALFIAAESGFPSTITLLLKAGADSSIILKNHNSALQVAIESRNQETAQQLINQNLDSTSYFKALIKAIITNQQSIYLKMIQRNDILDQKDSNGRTVLWHAANHGRLQLVQALIKKGTQQINLPDISGYTPLARSLSKNHNSISTIFLNHGANIHSVTKEKNTLLMLSVLSTDLEIVKILLQQGIRINAKNNIGDTALMMAVKEGNIEFVKQMILSGADLRLRNYDDLNAYQMAISAGYTEIANTIRESSGSLFKIFN